MIRCGSQMIPELVYNLEQHLKNKNPFTTIPFHDIVVHVMFNKVLLSKSFKKINI